MRLAAALALAWMAGAGCGGPGPANPASRPPLDDQLVMAPGLPPLFGIAREGDPAAAIAAFISMEGIEPGSGAAPAVMLAAILEARLAKAGFDVRVTAQWDGVRVDVLFAPEN